MNLFSRRNQWYIKKNYIKWHIVKILKSVNQRNRFKPLRHVEHVTLELEGKLEHVHLELEGKLEHVPLELEGKLEHVPLELEGKLEHVPLKLEGKLEHAPLKLEGKIKLQQSLSGVCCNVILIHLLKM